MTFLPVFTVSSPLFDHIVEREADEIQTQQLKLALDPLCLLNCDKVIRMQKPKAGEVAEW